MEPMALPDREIKLEGESQDLPPIEMPYSSDSVAWAEANILGLNDQ